MFPAPPSTYARPAEESRQWDARPWAMHKQSLQAGLFSARTLGRSVDGRSPCQRWGQRTSERLRRSSYRQVRRPLCWVVRQGYKGTTRFGLDEFGCGLRALWRLSLRARARPALIGSPDFPGTLLRVWRPAPFRFSSRQKPAVW